jgi:hypothetical protein
MPTEGPTPPAELLRVARRSVHAVDVTARFPRGQRLFRNVVVEVDRRARTELRLRVDAGGVYVSASPGLAVVGRGPLPDYRVTDLRYDFEGARFDLAAPRGFGGRVVEAAVEAFLNAAVQPKLPPKLRARGYDPRRDPDLPATVRALAAAFPLGGASADGGGAGAAGAGDLPGGPLEGAEALGVAMSIQVTDDVRVAIPGLEGLEVFLPRGRLLTVDARTRGPATAPSLDRLHVFAQDRGVVIRSTERGLRGLLEHFDVTAATLRPGARGPRIDVEYVFLLERMVDSALLLGELGRTLSARYGAGSAGSTPGGAAPAPVRIGELRPLVDRLLVDALQGLVRDLLTEFDELVPGVSLRAFFGAP